MWKNKSATPSGQWAENGEGLAGAMGTDAQCHATKTGFSLRVLVYFYPPRPSISQANGWMSPELPLFWDV